MYQYSARCIRVIDGDTLRLAVNLGLDITINITVRLKGIQAPERKGDTLAAGNSARDYLEMLVKETPLRVETFKDRKEKYGRYLAMIWIVADDMTANVNEKMILAGQAIAWEPM